MIKRFKVLAEDNERSVPKIGELASFQVIAVDDSYSLSSELRIFITAEDPNWGPRHARIEGYIRNGNNINTVLGYYATSETSDDYAGIIEVHLYEA